MTREQARIAGAWAAGETVQFRSIVKPDAKWINHEGADFAPVGYNIEWRIKPKAREWWVCTVCNRSASAYSDKPLRCPSCETPRVHVREVLE